MEQSVVERFIELLQKKPKLDRIQIANRDYSISWKEVGFRLFNDSNNEVQCFDAIKWCGRTGNVSRTVTKEKLDQFCKDVCDLLPIIKSGVFNLKSFNKTYPRSKPYSWVSKICHIINPKDYPLIYDSNVCKHFNLKNIDDFNELLEEAKNIFKGKTEREIYEYESSVWASETSI